MTKDTDEIVSISFDGIAERYDETRGGERRGEQLAADLAPLLDPARPVLEIGVGTGVIAKALARRGFAVDGIDISQQMLVRARDRIGARVARADARCLPFADASIDQAIAVWVLHVAGAPVGVLTEVARVLRPGGVCLVMDGKALFDPNDPVHVAYREIEIALGVHPRLGRVHEYAKDAPEAGLRVEDIADGGPHPYETSIRESYEDITTRAHSWMWDVDNELWDRVVTPVAERLRSEPTFEDTIRREGYQEILVLRR